MNCVFGSYGISNELKVFVGRPYDHDIMIYSQTGGLSGVKVQIPYEIQVAVNVRSKIVAILMMTVLF